MRSHRVSAALLLALSSLSVFGQYSPPQPHANGPLPEIKRFPGDGEGAYKTKQYRDLFAESGHSSEEAQAKIDARAFARLMAQAQKSPGKPSLAAPGPASA